MKGLLSIKQIIKKLKGARWSWIPSPEAIHILFDKYGVGPVGGSYSYLKYYYNGRYALDVILQHVMELKAIQERIDMRKNVIKMNHQDMDDTRDSYEDEVSFYHPKGMSNASIELLKNDEVFYESVRNENKKALIGLWLDDKRHDPNTFLSKKNASGSGDIVQQWYNKNMTDYDIQWTSVSNFEQFKNYIEEYGVPDFVSLDHDLGDDARNKLRKRQGLYTETGADCALWLVSYCLRKHIPIPRNYIHSANNNKRVFISKAFKMGRIGKDPLDGIDIDNEQEFIEAADRFKNGIIGNEKRLVGIKGLNKTSDLFDKTSFRESKNAAKKIYINESQLKSIFEDVYISGLKKDKAKLSYDKRNSTKRVRNLGNLKSSDMLDTSLMDQNNNDTFIVPLKGGIKSYNITSIRGADVMHYFKNKFDNKKAKTEINVNGSKSEYELMMEDSEFQEFLRMFTNKISNVVNYAIGSMGKDLVGVSIYPVPSSSNFNNAMASILSSGGSISNLPCRKVDTELFKKDLSNLQKDTEFISKNKDYYKSAYLKGDESGKSHEDELDDTIRKYQNTTMAQNESLINTYNICVNNVLRSYYNNSSAKTIAKNYVKLVDAKNAIRNMLKKSRWDKAFELKKYVKIPSINKRSQEIWDIVTPILGKTFMTKNNKDNLIDIVEIEKKNFQIKNLSNDVRMGLKNYFKQQDGIEEELSKIKNTVFVVFDDNISGGATLSDICYQASKLGINNIVPITFGKMQEKYSFGNAQVNKPKVIGL